MEKSFKTENEYNNALVRVYELMQIDIAESTTDFNELEKLSILIKEYELVHYPLST